MKYWQKCWYCGKTVRGGIQGIRGHLRGCPYIREKRAYQFETKTIYLDAGKTILLFYDTIFQYIKDPDVFYSLLDTMSRVRDHKRHMTFEIEDRKP